MARPIIRPCPIYLNGKKIAECQSGTYDIDSNDELHIFADGVGHSDGVATSNVSATCIVPVSGMSVTLEDALLNKRNVQIGIPIAGKFHQLTMRSTKLAYKWDHKNGMLTGDVSFTGSGPDITG